MVESVESQTIFIKENELKFYFDQVSENQSINILNKQSEMVCFGVISELKPDFTQFI